MSQKPNYFRLFFPVLLMFTLALGYFFGLQQKAPVFLKNPFQQSTQQGLMKIDRILEEIDRKYVDSINKDELVEIAIQSMLEKLDPHTVYIPPQDVAFANERIQGSFDGVGVRFLIIDDTLFVTNVIPRGPSYFAGIKDGDRILAVDTTKLVGVGVTNQQVFDNLRGERGTSAKMKVFRKGNGVKYYNVVRNQVPIKSVDASFMLDDNTGYLKLSTFAVTTEMEFVQASVSLLKQGMKNMILDLRGNSGGVLGAAITISDHFLPQGKLIVYTEGKSQPKREEFATAQKNLLEDVELIILIDNNSASASEIVAGAIQDNDRGLIYGRRSFGKGLVQEPIDLSDGSELRLTVSRYYTPAGRSIQKPYGNGVEYEFDINERYDAGEFYKLDSAMLDTLPKFKTTKGKTVYGGGGIFPDVFIPIDTMGTSYGLNKLFYEGMFNEFCFRFLDKNRAKMNKYKNVQEFAKTFQVSDQMINELISYSEKKGVSITKSDVEKSKERIKRRVKAGIANYIWEDLGLFYILLEEDTEVKRALSDF
jgi:carboxyl-terminal processing protease